MDVNGDLSAHKVVDLYRECWQNCIRGDYYPLRCWNCNRFQQNIMQLAALLSGEASYCCTCTGRDVTNGCWESISLHKYLKWLIPNFEMIPDQLVRADEKAIQYGAGVIDDTWRAKFRDEAPDIVKA